VPAAKRKVVQKRVDLIVANDVSAPGAGFDVDTNVVTLVTADAAEPLPLMSKGSVAAVILDRVAQLLAAPAALVASR
jgi:phosphopantothenoylcysteine decarboxylase/phosphopantothenate--cysteine ligase